MPPPPVALTIAGSDPSGGAGVQADLKTFHQLGVYGASAITLLTVQNTRGVTAIEPVTAATVAAQIDAVTADIPPAALKTGALGSAAIVAAVAERVRALHAPLVVDPVLVAKGGQRLVDDEAFAAVRDRLLPTAALVTPNLPEAAALVGEPEPRDTEAMERIARRLLETGVGAVLVKGGHLEGARSPDLLVTAERTIALDAPRVPGKARHGTGCTLSAAITALLAQGRALEEAVRAAKAFLTRAIETAPDLGAGHGPVNHFAAPP